MVSLENNREVYAGKLTQPKSWALADDETVAIADFSDVKTEGQYQLQVGNSYNIPIVINDELYRRPLAMAIKYYYYNRASTAPLKEHAGIYARPAGHPDNKVYIHPSASSKQRPEDTIISSPKGWYDAGDYNKYIVNSNITVYSMLLAWEACKEQGIEYPSDQPALSYVDHTCNFASNEEAINWNAPLVYVLTALQ